jgi:hypothetical protein
LAWLGPVGGCIFQPLPGAKSQAMLGAAAR